MLGIPDFWIWLAYVLCIASTLLSVGYGLIHWNKGGEADLSGDTAKWAEEEDKISEEL